VFTQERVKLFRRLIVRADPGCMTKPRWLSAAAEETRDGQRRNILPSEACPSKLKHRRAGSKTPHFRSSCHCPLHRCLGTPLNLGTANKSHGVSSASVPMPVGPETASWVTGATAGCSVPEATHSTFQQSSDLVSHFKDF